MWCSLRDSCSLGEEQLIAVRSFLLSTTTDSTSTSDPRKSDRDDLSSDSEDDALSSENGDTEKPAAVADWDDWGDGQANKSSGELPNPPLVRRSRASIDRENAKWLHTSLIGSTPLLDTIVLAREDRFVVLERGEDNFNIACQKRIEKADENDEIWSVAVLPIASNRKTETKPHDWTAVVVGLSSGKIHFYTERGVLIFVEQFTRTPALSIRLGQGLHNTQELAVLFKDCLAVIEGLSLYTALKSCRSQVARGMASVESLSEMVELNFRKFRLQKVTRTDDVAIGGPIKPSSFDQYETASILGGFYTRVHRTSLPFYSTYVLAGSEPFLTFSWYEEGGGQPVLSDAIYNLAGKLKSSVTSQMPSFGLSGLFGGHSRSEKTKTKPVDVRTTELPSRSQIIDAGRMSDKVFIAPGGRLAAVADSQARIMLVNTSLRQVVRVWKGYRDATCAWIESFGEVSQTNKKIGRALFLIIYAPRRGLLEVWAMQNGPRVSAFNVDKKGRLLTVSRPEDIILGGTSAGGGGESGVSSAASTAAAAFFVATDGRVVEIVAPFHLALQDESAASTHDENLIREIRAVLGAGPLLPADVAESRLLLLISELKTIAAKRKALDLILDMGHVPVTTVGRIVESLRTALAPNSNSTVSKSVEAQTFLPHLNAYSQLVNAFAFVDKLHKQRDDVDSTGDESVEEDGQQSIADLLKLTPEQLREDLSRLERCRRSHRPAESTTPTAQFSFTDLLACFDFAHLQHFPSLSGEGQDSSRVHTDWMNNKLKYASAALGRFLFAPALLGRCSVGDLINHILPQFGLDQSALVRLFCAHWLDADGHQITLYLPRVYRLFKALANMDAQSSEWLAIAQSEILACPLVAESFSLCLIVRAVASSVGDLKVNEDGMIFCLHFHFSSMKISKMWLYNYSEHI
uniref:Rab3-GAP regulatory subunit N-terminal domain-containing protein n=1 Tax=Plectus sambesii TaxID=2011161 RepID=A0A914VMM9_9BILA